LRASLKGFPSAAEQFFRYGVVDDEEGLDSIRKEARVCMAALR
jgi:hypothetical protein